MASIHPARPLAIVTGASSGIGRELARLAAEDGHDLVIAADQGPLEEAAASFRALGARVDAVEADLSTAFGVDKLMLAAGGRPVALLIANAGHGLGHGFLDKPFSEAKHVIDTNVSGTLDLIHRVGRDMRQRGTGRILITGSIAGLMPGATDTHFFERADMLDTKVGSEEKASPVDVAKEGYEAMKKGEDHVVAGWKNKVSAVMANVVPDSMLADQHRKMAKPGSARH